jgi:hypothetical protein
MSTFTLSEDDRRILDIYVPMYWDTVRQIDALQSTLADIRASIQRVTSTAPLFPQQINMTVPSAPSAQAMNPLPIYNNNPRGRVSHIQPIAPVGLPRSDVSSFPRSPRGEHPVTNRGIPYRVNPGQEPHNYITLDPNGHTQRWRYPYSLPNTRRQTTRTTSNINTGSSTRDIHFLYTFYEPVAVYPSEEQLQQGLGNTVFSLIDSPLNNSCPITMERFEDNSNVSVILGCNHIFNPSQIRNWFRNSCRCPVCRYDIRDYRRTAVSSEETKEEDILEETKEDEDEDEIIINNNNNRYIPRTSSINIDDQSIEALAESLINELLPRRNINNVAPLYNSLISDASGSYRI